MSGKQSLWLLILAAITLAALACDKDPGRKLALTTNQNGEILVHYKPCNEADAVISRIKLVQVKGRIYGDTDDPVLWEVESETGAVYNTFTIGVVPDGFEEKVALGEKSLSAIRLGLLVYAPTKRTAAESFRPADLRPDFVLSSGDYLPEDVFFKKYTCW
jgi:hypothetical protein